MAKVFAISLVLIFGLCQNTLAQTTCATDGSSASVSVTSDTYNNIPVWRIKSSGCPNWDWSKQSTPGTNHAVPRNIIPKRPTLQAQVINTEAIIPKNPIMCKNTLKIDRQNLAIKGIVGLLLNGVALFNDGDAQNRDAYIYEGKTMDQCLGHVAINTYHTHTMPGGCCLTKETQNSGHSPAFGVLADGVPIYGPFGDDGKAPTDLDECRGHVDKTHPFYHYHATPSLTGPYTVGCLKGCVISNFANNMQWKNYVGVNAAEKQYDYSSLKLNWDAAPVNASTINNCPYKYAPGAAPPPPFASTTPGGNNNAPAPKASGGKMPGNGGGPNVGGGMSGGVPGGKMPGNGGDPNMGGGMGGGVPGGKMPGNGGDPNMGGGMGGGVPDGKMPGNGGDPNMGGGMGGGVPGGKQGGPMGGRKLLKY